MRFVATSLTAFLCCLICSAASQDPQDFFDNATKATRERDFVSAERFSRAGLDAANAAHDNVWAGRFEQSIGDACLSQGRSKDARSAYEHALTLFDQAAAASYANAILLKLGGFEASLGNYPKAVDFLTRAQREFAVVHDQSSSASALDLLGQIHARLGRFEDANRELKEALTWFENGGDGKREAKIRGSLADLYRRQSDFRAAIEQGFRAFDGDEKFGEHAESAKVLDVLGNAFESIGQLDNALSYYRRALSIRETYSIKQSLSFSYKNIGAALMQSGRNAEALEYSRRGLELARSAGAPREIATSLIGIGGSESDLGHVEESRRSFAEALAVAQQHELIPEQALALYGLGNLALSAGRLDEALDLHRRALAIRETSHDRRNTVWSLNRLALALEAQGNLEAAVQTHRRALELFETIGKEITDPVQYGAYRQTSVVLYPAYARVLVKLGKAEEALLISERGRATGLSRLTDLNALRFEDRLNPSDAKAWQTAASNLSQASNGLRVILEKPDAAKAAASETEARAVYAGRQDELAELRDRLFAAAPGLRTAQDATPATIEQLLDFAGRYPDTLFVGWTMGDQKSSLVFALGADGVRAFPLEAGVGQIREASEAWLASLSGDGGRGVSLNRNPASPQEEPAQARKLYEAVFSELEPLLRARKYSRLVVVADGPLLNIPFAALIDRSGKRLIERYAISSSVSFGQLLHQAARRKPSKTMLAVADPLAPGEQRVVPPSSDRYQSLQSAAAESKAVGALYPGSVVLAGPAAREGDIKRLLPQFDFLHFATHGILDRQDGLRSGLLLATEPAGSTEDGILQAWEIAGLSLSARLAVLSACETGGGDERLGDGLLGLAWAFQAAGVPRVVASLWNVDDAATRDLMTAFYTALRSGSRVDEALRTATAKLRSSPRYSAPHYWAAFEILGDAGSLER